MKTLLIGRNGQIGTELRRTLLPFGLLVSTSKDELCLQNLSDLLNFLQTEKPDLIVNAAAYTAVDEAESERDLATLINASAVEVLAEYAKQNNTLLVHYSTDYVFDGIKNSPYLEIDKTNPQNVYGASKLAGEMAIAKSGCKHLIFRTSWVFSANGNNFIKTILNLAQDKTTIQVVNDQFGAPTSAEMVADITALAIVAYNNNRIPNGIYHLTASGKTSWYHFACYILDKALDKGWSFKLNIEKIKAVTSEEYPRIAKRPKNSSLDTRLLSETLALQIPEWKVYVDRTIEQMNRLEIVP